MLRIMSLALLNIGVATLTLLASENAGSSEKPFTTPVNQQVTTTVKATADSQPPSEASETILPASAFKTVEWINLMPEEDLDALLAPPSYVTDIEDGSLEDEISNQIENAFGAVNDDRYQQALTSTHIIPEMEGQAIRIAGFIVPLEFDDDQTITQFFLVPFFGACIHVPPPPPNQMIFVSYPKGLKLNALYDPFWISGILRTTLVENEMATAAYSMQLPSFEAYTE